MSPQQARTPGLQRAHIIIATYEHKAGDYEDDTQSLLTDLLTDLRHWADHQTTEPSFRDAVASSARHHLTEREGQPA